MPDIEIRGLNFVGVLRCSSNEQTEKSLPAQREAIQRWANDKGINIFEWIELGGKSATYSQQVNDLIAIIETKHQGKDFDGMLFDSYARFVRTEGDSNLLFGKAVEAELLLATVKDGLLMGDGRWAVRGAAADQAAGFSKDMGRNIARTVGQNIENGLIPATVGFAYGVDREYYDIDGTIMFNVRKHADGRVEIRDPHPPHATRHVMPRGTRRLGLRGTGCRYELVPRNDEHSETVKWIFHEHYINNRTAYAIAKMLNSKGVPGPRDKGWRALGVEVILHNPLYVGYSAGSVRQCGVNVIRAKGNPIMLAIPRRPGRRDDGKGTRKMPKIIYSDPNDWMISEQRKLKEFLPPDVRRLAMQEWERKQKEGWVKPLVHPKGSKLSKQTNYFLSRLLTTADGAPMVGVGTGNPTKGKAKYRYYQSSRSLQTPSHKNTDRCVRADLLEPEVKRAIADVIEVPENVESLIKSYVTERQRQVLASSFDVQKLHDEKKQLEGWYRGVFAVASGRGQEILGSEAKRVEARLDVIDGLVRGVDNAEVLAREASEVVASVKGQLKGLRASLDVASPPALRALCNVLVSKLTYDCQNRVVDLELGLPDEAIFGHGRISELAELRMDARRDYRSCPPAKCESGVILSKTQCLRSKTGRNSICLACHRLPDPALAAA